MKDLQFTVTYKGKTYEYDFGSQAYIFHTCLYNKMDRKYGKRGLLQYVALVQACYLADSNRTPLGAFADYVARNWKYVKELGRYEILEKFYTEDC